MPEYRRLIGWSRDAWPYAKELFSNEIYVYVSAVAMNALFSFPPFVILMVTVSKYLFPKTGIDAMIYAILRQYLPFTDDPAPPNDRSNLEFVIYHLRAISNQFGSIQIISLVVLVWAVASVFIPLELTLNRAFGIRESRGFWRSQWLAAKMVVAMAFIAFVFVLGATSTKNVVAMLVPASWPTTAAVISFINIKLWMVPLTLLLSCIVFYLAPNTKVPFKDVWPAAILTGLLWELSNYAFIIAVPAREMYELFGPFYVAITWMTWAYLGGLILVFGANLMAKRVLTQQIERMKEALWNFRTESPS